MSQCGISPKTFADWMDDSSLHAALQLQFRIKLMEGRSIIGRAVPMAAAKLVELLCKDSAQAAGSDKNRDEAIRKTCLDILSLGNAYEQSIACQDKPDTAPLLSDEEAEKLIRALTEDEDDPDDGDGQDNGPLYNQAKGDTEPL